MQSNETAIHAPVRWGVLSAANIAAKHVAPAIVASSNGRLAAVGSRNPQRAQKAGRPGSGDEEAKEAGCQDGQHQECVVPGDGPLDALVLGDHRIQVQGDDVIRRGIQPSSSWC